MPSGLPDWFKSVRLTGKYGLQLIPVAVDENGNLYAVIKGTDGTELRTVRLDADGYILSKLVGGTVDVGTISTVEDKDRNIKGYDGADYRAIAVDPNGIMLARLKGFDGSQLRDVLVDDEGRIVGIFKGRYTNPFDLVLDLPFDEGSGSIAYDQSLYGNDGTINGATWVRGRYGYALEFDGTDDYVKVLDSASLNITSGGITVAAWVYPTKTDAAQYIVEKYSASAGFRLFIRAANIWGYGFVGDLDTIDASGNEVDFNTWNFVVITYDYNTKTARIYVNGELQGETTKDVGIIDTSGLDLYIGSSDGGSLFFGGIIDEVRIYARALTEEEIRELYEGRPTLRVDRNGNLSALLYGKAGNVFKPVELDSLSNMKINTSVLGAESVEAIVLDVSDSLASGGQDNVSFAPPEGWIYEIISARLVAGAVPGASSGNHLFRVNHSATGSTLLYGKASYNKQLRYDSGEWIDADLEQLPSDKTNQLRVLRGVRIDSDTGITVNYTNGTDADQTGTRYMRFLVRKFRVS